MFTRDPNSHPRPLPASRDPRHLDIPLGNEANVTLRKNINLVPRLLSHFHTMVVFTLGC